MPESASKLKVNINLLHPQGVPVKLPVRILKWALSYGRFVAIAVEFLVIAMFIFRFKLDNDLAGIQQKINEQIPFIESLTSQEAALAQVKSKLTIVGDDLNSNLDWEGLWSKLSSQVPNGVTLTSVSIDHSQQSPSVQLKITGTATSNNNLAIFINGLKGDSAFQSIQLTNVNFDEQEGVLQFIITGGEK